MRCSKINKREKLRGENVKTYKPYKSIIKGDTSLRILLRSYSIRSKASHNFNAEWKLIHFFHITDVEILFNF